MNTYNPHYSVNQLGFPFASISFSLCLSHTHTHTEKLTRHSNITAYFE